MRDAVNPDQLYRLLVEQVSDYAIFALDTGGNVLTWNPGAQRFKGYEPSEIIGRNFSVFYTPEDVAAGLPQRLLEQARTTGHAEAEGWRVRKDGSRFWASITITALHDDAGRVVAFAKITRDLTQRRENEERERRLAAEEAAHAAALEKNHELETLTLKLQEQASELEAQTEEAQALGEEMEQANEALQQALDEVQRGEEASRYLIRGSEILGSSLDYTRTLDELAQLVVPELADWCAVEIARPDGTLEQCAVAHVDPDRVRWGRELNRRYPARPDSPTGAYAVLRTGQPELYPVITDEMLVAAAIDEEHLRLTRELGIKSAIVVPMIAHGPPIGVLTLIASESARRYTETDKSLAMELAHRAAMAVENARLHEKAVKSAEEAKHANRAKTDFLATMSHELRTPLNAILGYTDLLQAGVRGQVSADQVDYLERIARSGRYLLSLIQDVLSFAKLESGRVEVNIQSVAVRPALDEMEKIILPQAHAAGLAFDPVECGDDVAVRADPERMRQILLNLLTNAVKFTPAAGRISLSCESDDGKVRVAVRDTGRGIPPEKLDEIFAPFVQLHRDASGAQAGTGLGLAISRDLARAMNGELAVESRLNEGSTFTLTLPRASAEPTATTPD